MKKIIALLTTLTLCCSCCEYRETPSQNCKFEFEGHQYIAFKFFKYSNGVGIVHDPDCPCMIDYE